MLSGAIIAFVVIRYNAGTFVRNLVYSERQPSDTGITAIVVALKYLIPIQVVVLLSWWIFRSVTEFAPDTWYNPFDSYSIATVVSQWVVAALILFVLNTWLVKRHE